MKYSTSTDTHQHACILTAMNTCTQLYPYEPPGDQTSRSQSHYKRLAINGHIYYQ
jgi:hypothetical protein